jgi:hypothetical protein
MDDVVVQHSVFVVSAFQPALADKALPYPKADVFSSWTNALHRFRRLASRMAAHGCAFDVHRESEAEGFAIVMATAQQAGVVLQCKRVDARSSRSRGCDDAIRVVAYDDGDEFYGDDDGPL